MNGDGFVDIALTGQLLDVHRHVAELCDEGRPCDMCGWANEQEGHQPAPPQLELWLRPADDSYDLRASPLTYQRVRQAIFDALDSNHSWGYEVDESDRETERRVRFVDAVMRRLKGARS